MLPDQASSQVAAVRAAADKAAKKAGAARKAAALSQVGLDPRLDWRYEADDAGYGDYIQGRDPEYDWYDARDNDGLVCETR